MVDEQRKRVEAALRFNQRYGTSDPDELKRIMTNPANLSKEQATKLMHSLGYSSGVAAADGSLARLLDYLTADQRTNYRMVHGIELTADPDDVRIVGMALVDEVMELCKELGWKPWKPNHTADEEKILEEFADVVCFFGTLAATVMERTGCTAADLQEAYKRKQLKNRARFRGEVPGYEGSHASTRVEQAGLGSDPVSGSLFDLQTRGDFRGHWFDVEYSGDRFRAMFLDWASRGPLEDGTLVWAYRFRRDDNGAELVLKPQVDAVHVRLARDAFHSGVEYDVALASGVGLEPTVLPALEYLGRRTSAGSPDWHVFKGSPRYLDPSSPWWGATETGQPHAGVYYQVGPSMRRRFIQDDGFRWWFEDALSTPMPYDTGVPITRSFDYDDARGPQPDPAGAGVEPRGGGTEGG